MLLKSPPNLHYPITVTSLLRQTNEEVLRATALFSYTYRSKVSEGDRWGNWTEVEKTFPTRFESETDGRIVRWMVKVGEVVKAPNVDLLEIEEPCKHDVQFGGMCAMCGKDLTKVDYNTTVPETARADTNITPAHAALRISSAEAGKLDRDAKLRLLSQQKLSLVVDLDLTIIQATVDTTIGEWQQNPSNPNYDAIKNVRSFTLQDEGQGLRGPEVAYYVKMRPGLRGFLDRMARKYELHIYTMGTRAYAENIAKIVDPTRELFGDRILSRTETPGEVSKNLRKLFPVDSKMVVIIDDRADVWRYSDYLVPVVPYNFFVGIGDINASFLPKREDMMAKMNEAAGSAAASQSDNTALVPADKSAVAGETAGDASPIAPLDTLVEMRGSPDISALQQQAAEQDETLAAQVNEKPLLQKQKELDEMEDGGMADGDDPEESVRHQRQPLLQDDDRELDRIENMLTTIWEDFYRTYHRNVEDAALTINGSSGRIGQLKGKRVTKIEPSDDLTHVPDVKDIIEPRRTLTLRGTVIAFSAVIFTHIPVHHSLIGRTAMRLGAEVVTDITPDTTHLVTRPGEPTSKIRRAIQRGGIKIVGIDWIFESSVQWKRLDEEPYKIDFEGLSATTIDGNADAGSADESDAEANQIGLGTESQAAKPSLLKDLSNDEWDNAYKEIAELEDDDSDSDSQSGDSDSDTSQANTQSDRKRKLDEESSGSTLQWRKRKALERSSSLNMVSTIGADTESVNTDQEATQDSGQAEKERAEYGGGQEEKAEEEEDEDDFAALEAQLASSDDENG